MPPILGIWASSFAKATPDTGSMFPIGEFTLTGTQSSIEFTNIPQTYTHLQLRCNYRVNTGATEIGGFRVNGNTGGIYYAHKLEGDGATASSSYRSGGNTSAKVGVATNAVSNAFSTIILDILDYKNTNKNKTWRSFYGTEGNGSGWVGLFSGYAATTSAITSISLFPETSVSFVENSSFQLYGVLA